MTDLRIEQAVAVLRDVLNRMAPAPTDTIAARVAKVAFGISAVTMVTSAATVLVTAPRMQLSAS